MSRRQAVLGGIAAFAAAGVAHARRREGAAQAFETTELEVWLPGLDPAHDGLKIAQLSDLHTGIGTPDGRIIHALREAEASGAELLVLTGDYVTVKRDSPTRVGELLEGWKRPAFAVLGNHDHWTHPADIRNSLERANVTVLQNANTVTRVRGAPFALIGIDDEHSGHDDVARSFGGAPKRGSRLVLAHTPVTVDELPARSGLLCLSGHTHGGQVYVPGMSERLFAAANSPYLRGRYDLNGNQLYVNRGIGMGRGSYGVRIASPAELSIFTLRRAD